MFRLAHDTWADDAQAAAMRSEGVEADVSLESNVATGAYPIDRMPLGAASLKHLLEHHVRCLLGTDAAGVEHSDIAKEYRYASALIAYWNETDPQFRARAGAVNERTLFDDVARHLHDMASDARMPYAEPGD